MEDTMKQLIAIIEVELEKLQANELYEPNEDVENFIFERLEEENKITEEDRDYLLKSTTEEALELALHRAKGGQNLYVCYTKLY